MNEERQAQLRGHIRGGLLVSFLLHASVFLPFVFITIVLARREAAQRPDEVDVEWKSVSESDLPDDLPRVDETKPDPRQKKRPKKESPLAAAQPDKKPEPEPEVPPPEPKKETPPTP